MLVLFTTFKQRVFIILYWDKVSALKVVIINLWSRVGIGLILLLRKYKISNLLYPHNHDDLCSFPADSKAVERAITVQDLRLLILAFSEALEDIVQKLRHCTRSHLKRIDQSRLFAPNAVSMLCTTYTHTQREISQHQDSLHPSHLTWWRHIPVQNLLASVHGQVHLQVSSAKIRLGLMRSPLVRLRDHLHHDLYCHNGLT